MHAIIQAQRPIKRIQNHFSVFGGAERRKSIKSRDGHFQDDKLLICTWEPLRELKEAKGHIEGHSARIIKQLLKLKRKQLRWVLGLVTGHHFKPGLTDSCICERCKETTKRNHPHITYVTVRI
jgi:hypothetical protein